MSGFGIQGQLLEVTVVGCNKLKDTEWISRQDPYVCLQYGSNKFQTRTCTDGGKNPCFQEKYVFTLIEGLRELNVAVWNSNTLTHDDLIGTGNVQLQKVLSQGYDNTAWSLQSKSGRYSGEVNLILYYANANANKSATMSFAPSAPPHMVPSAPQVSIYASYPSLSYPSVTTYPAPAPAPYPSYPPNHAVYSPSPYPPHPQPAAYPPQPYPPSVYPPQQVTPGPYPNIYPPPPY